MRRSRGRVVVVTGATAGVGRATVRAFAKLGDDVALLARGRDGLAATAREVEALGSRCLAIPTDVADSQAVDEAAARIERTLGPIDVWVNNAMVSVFSPVRAMRAEEFRRVTEVTYLGCVHGTLAALRSMAPRGRGTIVQVGSALSRRGIPLQSAYCAAKHAILGFFESLRAELLHDGIDVHLTMVQLPALNTPQFDWVKSRLPRRAQPVPPIFQPEVAAEAIVYAAGARKRIIRVGAPVVSLDLAQKFAPRWLDRRFADQGYEEQQTAEPERLDRRDNLWNPVPGDHGAHGRFDERARSFSAQFWASRHGKALFYAASSLMLACAWKALGPPRRSTR